MGYGTYWMDRWRIVKERDISMLARCRIVVRCVLVQNIRMCIHSSCGGIPIEVYGM